jgi:hypothetical protein
MSALIVNLHLAAQHPLIGHGHHIDSLRDITDRLNKGVVEIAKEDLEAALWACNMLDELEEFWTPYVKESRVKNYSEFSRFITKIQLPYGHKFDRFFNTIEDKRRKR